MAAKDLYEKDYYAILGVAKDADAAEIKKVYRKLARELHPDTNKGNKSAEERFKEVSEAYDILSDPKKRAEYDEARSLFERGGFQGGFPGGFQGGFQGGDFGEMFSGDLGDMLGGLFGGRARGPRRGQDLQAETTISFRDAINGTQISLRTQTGTVTARIPAGVADEQRIRLKGKGAPGQPGAPSGDLFITVRVAPHPIFTRKGENLSLTLPVTFAEAALGSEISVPTLSGENVKVRIAPGTANGRTLRVKGHGLAKKNGGHGDLYVTIDISVPQRLEERERALLEEFAALTANADPRVDFFRRAKE